MPVMAVSKETLPINLVLPEADTPEKDYSEIPHDGLRLTMYRFSRVLPVIREKAPFPWDHVNVTRFTQAFADYEKPCAGKLVDYLLEHHILPLRTKKVKGKDKRVFTEDDVEAVVALSFNFEEEVCSGGKKDYKGFINRRKKQLGDHPLRERIRTPK